MLVWRVGHNAAPCDFPPKDICKWIHRFDDPRREYRTLYCAPSATTCLMEILADFKPDMKALTEYQRVFHEDIGKGELAPMGSIPSDFLRKKVLAKAELVLEDGEIVNIEDLQIRKGLEQRHASFLNNHGIKHLHISELRGDKRIVSQYLSRALFDDGAAGIRFNSHLNNGACCALFEARAHLRQIGDAIPLASCRRAVNEVCNALGVTVDWSEFE